MMNARSKVFSDNKRSLEPHPWDLFGDVTDFNFRPKIQKWSRNSWRPPINLSQNINPKKSLGLVGFPNEPLTPSQRIGRRCRAPCDARRRGSGPSSSSSAREVAKSQGAKTPWNSANSKFRKKQKQKQRSLSCKHQLVSCFMLFLAGLACCHR